MSTLSEKFEEFITQGLIRQEASVPFDNTVNIFADQWNVSKAEVRKIIFKAVESNLVLIDYDIRIDEELIRPYSNDLDKLIIAEHVGMENQEKIKTLEQRIQDLEAIVVGLKTKLDG